MRDQHKLFIEEKNAGKPSFNCFFLSTKEFGDMGRRAGYLLNNPLKKLLMP